MTTALLFALVLQQAAPGVVWSDDPPAPVEEVAVAADRLALFSEIGVPWASAARRRTGGAAAERTG